MKIILLIDNLTLNISISTGMTFSSKEGSHEPAELLKEAVQAL